MLNVNITNTLFFVVGKMGEPFADSHIFLTKNYSVFDNNVVSITLNELAS